MRNARQKRGDWGEGVARGFLGGKGYRVLGQNIRSPFGEIDLVCADGRELVIVEVKTRRSTTYGYPEGSVTRAKQKTLRQLAEWYWKWHQEYKNVRVDVVSILADPCGGDVEITHHQAAV